MLGYELKTAVGTSVFIMAFTAFTGAVSHFMIGGVPDWTVFILCVVFTLIWARIAARFANKATPETLNQSNRNHSCNSRNRCSWIFHSVNDRKH